MIILGVILLIAGFVFKNLHPVGHRDRPPCHRGGAVDIGVDGTRGRRPPPLLLTGHPQTTRLFRFDGT